MDGWTADDWFATIHSMAALPFNSESYLRSFALEVVHRLRGAGFEAVWAGGCVRDALLGVAPADYDVATSALPDDVIRLFGSRKTVAVGASFGVILVQGKHKSDGQVEVATFRSDGEYSDGRRPDSVQFCSAEEDACRRDFTINGMFFDPAADQVIDYVGGQQDLERGVVRAIGNPEERIEEDKLRMLRAPRFAARLDFCLDEATAAIDTETEQLIQEALEHLMQGRTSILIAHRLQTIETADRVLVLKDGKVKELGTHQELMALRGVYYTLTQLQFQDVSS